jgi:hypothetical protein
MTWSQNIWQILDMLKTPPISFVAIIAGFFGFRSSLSAPTYRDMFERIAYVSVFYPIIFFGYMFENVKITNINVVIEFILGLVYIFLLFPIVLGYSIGWIIGGIFRSLS